MAGAGENEKKVLNQIQDSIASIRLAIDKLSDRMDELDRDNNRPYDNYRQDIQISTRVMYDHVV